jgi:hypothetical protein
MRRTTLTFALLGVLFSSAVQGLTPYDTIDQNQQFIGKNQ